MKQRLLAFGVALGCGLGLVPINGQSTRTTVLISDMHMGVGRVGGQWSAFEDFRWADDFAAFLDHFGADSPIDLVLLGDTFELWQSLDADCRASDPDLGCDEAGAAARMRRVVREHQPTLAAIGRFARRGGNTVTLVPGNHDAGLFFPAVQSLALGAIDGGPRVTVAAAGSWASADGAVYAEHGQQIGEEVNRFDGWPLPFVSRGTERYLQRPWGEKFVQDFYNQYEEKYPIIDNISEESAGIRYGMKTEGKTASILAAGRLLKFFILDISTSQLGNSLGHTGAYPQWDVAAVRSRGDQSLIDALRDDPDLYAEAEAAVRNGTLPLHIAGMSDAEISDLCDAQAMRRLTAGSRVPGCPETLGAAAQNLLRRRDAAFRRHIGDTLKARRAMDPAAAPFKVFVYGHTHLAQAPFVIPDDPSGAELVNTGAWQRVITPDGIKQVAGQIPDSEVLSRIHLNDLPACYSFVLIPPHAHGTPRPALRYWRQLGGRWDEGPGCR